MALIPDQQPTSFSAGAAKIKTTASACSCSSKTTQSTKTSEPPSSIKKLDGNHPDLRVQGTSVVASPLVTIGTGTELDVHADTQQAEVQAGTKLQTRADKATAQAETAIEAHADKVGAQAETAIEAHADKVGAQAETAIKTHADKAIAEAIGAVLGAPAAAAINLAIQSLTEIEKQIQAKLKKENKEEGDFTDIFKLLDEAEKKLAAEKLAEKKLAAEKQKDTTEASRLEQSQARINALAEQFWGEFIATFRSGVIAGVNKTQIINVLESLRKQGWLTEQDLGQFLKSNKLDQGLATKILDELSKNNDCFKKNLAKIEASLIKAARERGDKHYQPSNVDILMAAAKDETAFLCFVGTPGAIALDQATDSRDLDKLLENLNKKSSAEIEKLYEQSFNKTRLAYINAVREELKQEARRAEQKQKSKQEEETRQEQAVEKQKAEEEKARDKRAQLRLAAEERIKAALPAGFQGDWKRLGEAARKGYITLGDLMLCYGPSIITELIRAGQVDPRDPKIQSMRDVASKPRFSVHY